MSNRAIDGRGRNLGVVLEAATGHFRGVRHRGPGAGGAGIGGGDPQAGGKTAPFTGADLLGISFAFGLIITALVYALGKVSGCHINPAVTLALAVTKRMPWRDVPFYWASQFVGAVIGAFGIWAIFGQAGIDLGLGHAAFNPDTTSYAAAAFAEFLGTALLMLAILGIVDTRSPGDLAGIVIGGVVIAIIMVVGPITNASLQPRPRLRPRPGRGDRRRQDRLGTVRPGLPPPGTAGNRGSRVLLRLPGQAAHPGAVDRHGGHPSGPGPDR